MQEGNYIKMYRTMLEWEWYSDINTKVLFLHMLLKANWKDGNFRGTTVPRGSFVSSVKTLSEETKLTEQEVKTAIKHLKSTKEITSKSTNKFTVFTIKNYIQYQTSNQQSNEQITNEQQTNNNQLTTIEERKKERREYKKNKKEKELQQSLTELFENHAFSVALQKKIKEWLEYKSERKESYKPQGLKSLLTVIEKKANEYGEAAVIELITICMSSNWKGIIWDKMQKKSDHVPRQGATKFSNFPERVYAKEDYSSIEQKIFQKQNKQWREENG